MALPKPVVVTISHELGRDEARHRRDDGLNQIRRLPAPFTSSLEHRWVGYRLEFAAAVMWQSITGHIDIEDRLLRIELGLPALLDLPSRTISRRISAPRVCGCSADRRLACRLRAASLLAMLPGSSSTCSA